VETGERRNVMPRRGGGIFVGAFLAVGAVQAVTGFIPNVPSAASVIPARAQSNQDFAFTGSSKPIKPGSVPEKSWENLINKWGNLCPSLTPALLAGQLHQESMGFNRDVISGKIDSPAGAKGMAQFIDATWNAHAIDANKDGKRDKYDPRDAIPSAAVYDCEVAKYVKGVPGDRHKNMLAAYNAGSNAVKKYNGIPPYKETQNYVRIIERKAARYEQ
jgi:soluble lytic murein transglycosylase-like protein